MAEIYGGYFLAVFCGSIIPPYFSIYDGIIDNNYVFLRFIENFYENVFRYVFRIEIEHK
ncbi:hypothetical protein GMO_14900 [Gluconobacter morbifer G707]|uniref:Uncharacterized protein n=1 Tax=Gluconobacter morbifer G707 TaxID=1088869 RepID=G6XJ24_9PROT|nr:hypothetical protein GMO_14900 [Gluconobacter morbifer G707]